MPNISTEKAAKLANVTSRTIQNKIKAGKISASRDDKGNYQINLSEFYRVYPNANNDESTRNNSRNKDENETQDNSQSVIQIDLLKTENTMLKAQIDLLQKQLDKSESRENKLLDAVSATTKLLEHDQQQKIKKKRFGLF